MLLFQFPWTFHHIQDALFHHIAYDYSHADWDNLCDHFRDVPWEDIFKLSASAAAGEFCEFVQVGIDIYIPHRKCQVKHHSSPLFSAACAAAIVAESKVKFRQASNRFKRVLEAAKHAYANKAESITSQKHGSRIFGEFPIVFSAKVNMLCRLYSTAWRCCLLHPIKQNCFLKTFLRTLILMIEVSLHVFSLLKLI